MPDWDHVPERLQGDVGGASDVRDNDDDGLATSPSLVGVHRLAVLGRSDELIAQADLTFYRKQVDVRVRCLHTRPAEVFPDQDRYHLLLSLRAIKWPFLYQKGS